MTGNLVAFALAVGFPESLGECALLELTQAILDDKWLMDLATRNFSLELGSPPPHDRPDDIFMATVESLSHAEKAALRARVRNSPVLL
jgi:hypothetical protein